MPTTQNPQIAVIWKTEILGGGKSPLQLPGLGGQPGPSSGLAELPSAPESCRSCHESACNRCILPIVLSILRNRMQIVLPAAGGSFELGALERAGQERGKRAARAGDDTKHHHHHLTEHSPDTFDALTICCETDDTSDQLGASFPRIQKIASEFL